jgi:hypothetical protein
VEENNEEKRATRNSWQNLKLMSSEKTQILLNRVFSEEEFSKLSFGLIPQAMEDKWLIFLEDNTLYFHRSWTGECIYEVKFSKEQTKYVPKEVWVCRDSEKYKFTSNGYDEKILSFLIENLLLGNNIPFPLLQTLANSVKGVFQHNISGTGYKENIIEED